MKMLKQRSAEIRGAVSAHAEALGQTLALAYTTNPQMAMDAFKKLEARVNDWPQSEKPIVASALLKTAPQALLKAALSEYIHDQAMDYTADKVPFRETYTLTEWLFGTAIKEAYGSLAEELISQRIVGKEDSREAATAKLVDCFNFVASKIGQPPANSLLSHIFITIDKEISAGEHNNGKALACNTIFLRMICPSLVTSGYKNLSIPMQSAVNKNFNDYSALKAIGERITS
jgi:hypothetical protein